MYFNPRTRMGCDIALLKIVRMLRNFNPRTRMGCDVYKRLCCDLQNHFNPRTRMGCDMSRQAWAAALAYFNPRTRMGCDSRARRRPPPSPISIHAPAWGATMTAPDAARCWRDFNPRTRMGCDFVPCRLLYGGWQFQSTHPHGVRRSPSCTELYQKKDFNPRTRMGCDCIVNKQLTFSL